MLLIFLTWHGAMNKILDNRRTKSKENLVVKKSPTNFLYQYIIGFSLLYWMIYVKFVKNNLFSQIS